MTTNFQPPRNNPGRLLFYSLILCMMMLRVYNAGLKGVNLNNHINPKERVKKKLAFVLSGGGSRGALQVGALRALLEAATNLTW